MSFVKCFESHINRSLQIHQERNRPPPSSLHVSRTQRLSHNCNSSQWHNVTLTVECSLERWKGWLIYNQAGSCATGVTPRTVRRESPRVMLMRLPPRVLDSPHLEEKNTVPLLKVSNGGFRFSMWVLGGSRPKSVFFDHRFVFLPSFVLYSHNCISSLHSFYPTRSDINKPNSKSYVLLMTRYRLVLINSWGWNLNSHTISSLCVQTIYKTLVLYQICRKRYNCCHNRVL